LNQNENTANSDVSSDIVAEIVAAYVGNHNVAISDIPNLVATIHSSMSKMGAVTISEEPREPAVPIRSSIKPDFLVCLEDGLKFKSLKRHLRTKYGLSPDDYKTKWGLPKDYPLVAPNYSKARSDLAKTMGLGQGGRKAAGVKGRGGRKAAAPEAAVEATAEA
jgi:predicted transcriptional regulator